MQAANAEESFCSLEFAGRAATIELGKATKRVSKSPKRADGGGKAK